MAEWLSFTAVAVFSGVFACALWWLLKLAQSEIGFRALVFIALPCLLIAWLIGRKIFRVWLSTDRKTS